MAGKVPTEAQWGDLTKRISPNKTFYGTCTTGATAATKVVECPNFKASDLTIGARIAITMAEAQSYTGQVYLNVNNTGAQKFYVIQDQTDATGAWQAGTSVDCVYDGLGWCLVGTQGGGAGVDVVQTTGDSTESVMSQKAVSDGFINIQTQIDGVETDLVRINTGAGVAYDN